MKARSPRPAFTAAALAISLCGTGALFGEGGFGAPASTASPAVGDPTAAAPSVANYQPSRMIGMRPHEKRALTLKTDERNPYARRSPDQEATTEESENLEEIRIRETLNSLSVTGRSLSPNGLRLLLGDIILEQGKLLPPLLEEQSEDLQVIDVTEDSITLGWLDIETGQLTGKTIEISYDLSPSVSYALHGQKDSAEGADSSARRMTVVRPSEEERRLRSRLATSAPDPDLPAEVIQAGQ